MNIKEEMDKLFIEQWRESDNQQYPPVPILNMANDFSNKVQALMPDMKVEVILMLGNKTWTRSDDAPGNF